MSPLSCPLGQQPPGDHPVDAGFECDKTAMLRDIINGALCIFKIETNTNNQEHIPRRVFQNSTLLINAIFTDNIGTLHACEALGRVLTGLEPRA